MHRFNPRLDPPSLYFVLIALLDCFSPARAVDITLSSAFSPFGRSVAQTCTDILPGVCCQGLGPAHVAFFWAGVRVSNLPEEAVASAFHANPFQPRIPYFGGCSGIVIGHGFGPGTWTWGAMEGIPLYRQPLSGALWIDRLERLLGPTLQKPKGRTVSSSSPSEPHAKEMPVQIAKREKSDAMPASSVLPDIITVDNLTYTDARKEGVYRDEHGRPSTWDQIMRATVAKWILNQTVSMTAPQF